MKEVKKYHGSRGLVEKRKLCEEKLLFVWNIGFGRKFHEIHSVDPRKDAEDLLIWFLVNSR